MILGRDAANGLSSVTLIFRDLDSVPDPLDACAISTRYLQKIFLHVQPYEREMVHSEKFGNMTFFVIPRM